jgi:hypothetical protein
LQTSSEDPVKGRTVRTHRSASARPVAVGVWVCAAGTLAWLLVAGDLDAAIQAVPWLVLLSWFVYVFLWRPCLRIDDSGFEVINGVRDHRIPFGTVEDIEVRYTTAIWAAGRKYVSWGAPTPPTAFVAGYRNNINVESRPFTMLPSDERIIIEPETNTGRDAIVAAWQKARSSGLTSTHGVVISVWNAWLIVLGLLALFPVIAATFV